MRVDERQAGMKRIPTRKPTQEEFERFFGRPEMGTLARTVYPFYFWWMHNEFRNAKTPQDRAMLHATPRAQVFWFVCGLVCAVQIVLVVMFLLTR